MLEYSEEFPSHPAPPNQSKPVTPRPIDGCMLHFIYSGAVKPTLQWTAGLTSALHLTVPLEALLALADVLGRQVAALSVVHTLARQLGDGALVNICNKGNRLIFINIKPYNVQFDMIQII